ncbi:hypothetical protein ACIQPQ_08015 [Streptomyces sp. NPDC091281]|uniref:hypothetical protein n=1 Tax=Streptomyces sp. NPDC091281 TaxID=3365985 RepID=UPI00380A77DC
MPADEVTTGSGVDAARVRTGPRHAAPKKPLFTRLHMPAGKAIALAAMPTAVLMGMGFTPTLANAEDQPKSKSLTIDEYKDCLDALKDAEQTDKADDKATEDDKKDDKDESAEPSASPSPSNSSDPDDDSGDGASDGGDGAGGATGSSGGGSGSSGGDASAGSGSTGTSGSGSSDSGSDDTAPAPSAQEPSAGDPAPAPAPSAEDKNLLETIGDAITDLFDGKDDADKDTGTGAPAGQPSASPSPSASADAGSGKDDAGKETSDKDTPDKAASGKETSGKGTAAEDEKADSTDQAGTSAEDDKAAADGDDTADEGAEDDPSASASPSPSPSASASTDVNDCPVATEDESGVDNKLPLADDPWYLNASSLLLKGADYQGVVEVKTANGTKKKVLKYVISDGTDIGDLHQTVDDKQEGVTYHVQAGSGTTSTIRNGDTIMYTQSISGNLFGLIPVTFDPEHPPPLNIPLIYFTKVKVVQAAQFGGDLHIPGMRVYNTK